MEDSELYKKFMRPLLQNVSLTPIGWTVNCPERLIFQTLILNSGKHCRVCQLVLVACSLSLDGNSLPYICVGPALSNCLDVMVPTLSASLCPENEDAEMKLNLLTSLAVILQNTDKTHCISTELMEPFLFQLIKGR